MPLRLFVAVDLPPETRDAVTVLCTGIAAARWVHPDQLHLTLRFLGDTPEDRVEDIRASLARVTQRRFSVAASGVGVFPPRPSRRNPARVLWTGLSPAAPLVALKGAIDAALGADPESRGRPFAPHVTLARFKAPPGPDLDGYLEHHGAFATAPFEVDAFHLYASTLGAPRPRHDVLARFPLTDR